MPAQRMTDHPSRKMALHFTGDTSASILPDQSLPPLIPDVRLVLNDSMVEWLALPTDVADWSRLTRLLSIGKRLATKGECRLQTRDRLEWCQGMRHTS